MPSKGQKIASSQKAARQRSRKRKGRPTRAQPFKLEPSQPSSETSMERAGGSGDQQASSAVATARQPQSTAQRTQTGAGGQTARRPRQRTVSEPLVYKFIGGELRQIGAVSVIIAAILGVLTFVLGG